MTDEKIIKAFEICASDHVQCQECPYKDYCETGGERALKGDVEK